MEHMLPKVKFLREQFAYLNIQVDGGVGPKNVHQCAENGANWIVSGTAIINSRDRKETIRSMKEIVERKLESFQ